MSSPSEPSSCDEEHEDDEYLLEQACVNGSLTQDFECEQHYSRDGYDNDEDDEHHNHNKTRLRTPNREQDLMQMLDQEHDLIRNKRKLRYPTSTEHKDEQLDSRHRTTQETTNRHRKLLPNKKRLRSNKGKERLLHSSDDSLHALDTEDSSDMYIKVPPPTSQDAIIANTIRTRNGLEPIPLANYGVSEDAVSAMDIVSPQVMAGLGLNPSQPDTTMPLTIANCDATSSSHTDSRMMSPMNLLDEISPTSTQSLDASLANEPEKPSQLEESRLYATPVEPKETLSKPKSSSQGSRNLKTTKNRKTRVKNTKSVKTNQENATTTSQDPQICMVCYKVKDYEEGVDICDKCLDM